jgi:peptidoglycan/LPS O-acetylase OafA/YrhL
MSVRLPNFAAMSGNSQRLQKLEAVRGLAGFYVFVHHYVHCNAGLAFLQPFFIFGQTAVMVFFILSGFVIYYSSAGRDRNFKVRDFLVRRIRRIYPAYILILLMGWGICCLSAYEWIDLNWRSFLGNLLMLQDKQHPFTWFLPYLGNSPLWSLSYEWWFYLMYLPVYFLAKEHPLRQQYLAAAISVLGFASFMILPNQISIMAAYFMLWWSGVELAREYLDKGKITWRRQAFSMGMIAVNAGLWVSFAAWQYFSSGKFSSESYPFVQVQHQVTVLAMVVAGIAWYKLQFVGFDRAFGVFKHLSPISYVLYIIHLPLILYAAHIQVTGSVWLDILWLFPLILGLSWLIEVPLQNWINRVVK